LAAAQAHGGQPSAENDNVASLRAARQDGRLIVTEYPYRPARRPIEERAGGQLIAARFRQNEERIRDTLHGIARHMETLARIPREQASPLQPFWSNDWFPPFDGAALYGLIAENAPSRYIEVGSGISTRFARQAVRDHGLRTRIVSIDPHPHNATDGLCDETIVARMEDLPSTFWAGITSDDMLFIDNSHRSFPNSDVTVFFTEVLPALPSGVLYGMHDIFLPCDYPEEWRDRFYNEQYLLMTYLLGGGGGDQVVLPVCWAYGEPSLHGVLSDLWNRNELFGELTTHGGAYWARRFRK
jgi:predicted O-methyltransferase YrrM